MPVLERYVPASRRPAIDVTRNLRASVSPRRRSLLRNELASLFSRRVSEQ